MIFEQESFQINGEPWVDNVPIKGINEGLELGHEDIRASAQIRMKPLHEFQVKYKLNGHLCSQGMKSLIRILTLHKSLIELNDGLTK